MTMHKHDNQVSLDAYVAGSVGIVADVRLDLDTTTQVKILGIPGTSAKITVAGEAVDCAAAKTCAKTANDMLSACQAVKTKYPIPVKKGL
jgi:hypothetical protein